MLEEPDVQVQVQTQSTSYSGQRESGGQDPSVIDLKYELQQDTDIRQPQQVDTRPRPKWFRSTVQDSRKVDPPQTSFRWSVPPERINYMALMTDLIKYKTSSFGKVAQHDVCQEAMVEEYDSIMKNQVWEVVPRPQGKKVVGSKWIYKVKHAADESMEKYQACFMEKGF